MRTCEDAITFGPFILEDCLSRSLSLSLNLRLFLFLRLLRLVRSSCVYPKKSVRYRKLSIDRWRRWRVAVCCVFCWYADCIGPTAKFNFRSLQPLEKRYIKTKCSFCIAYNFHRLWIDILPLAHEYSLAVENLWSVQKYSVFLSSVKDYQERKIGF